MIASILYQWLELGARWLHVMAGIAWVGTSFYFNWFDSLVRPTPDQTQRDNNRGTLEEIHGGSFYYHEQYWPNRHPDQLMRHSWPAKTTFLSGLLLLVLIYWVGAASYMVDASVANITPIMAIAISAFSIVLCWIVYRAVCCATEDNRVVLAVMALITLFMCWGLAQVFGARAAWLQVGAVLGSMMGLNVWRVIVPNHIAMTRQLAVGDSLDTHHGYLAKRASQHNNYFTLPVVLAMISNHFAFAYGSPYAWLVLFLMCVAGWSIRHAFNVHYKTAPPPIAYLLLMFVCVISAVGLTLIPRPTSVSVAEKLSDADIAPILATHCSVCHSVKPSFAGFVAPPQGMALDTTTEAKTHSAKIYPRLMVSRDMPLGNVTQMSEAERAKLAAWLLQK